MLNEEKIEKFAETTKKAGNKLIKIVKEKGIAIISDVKNFKELSKERKRNIIILIAVVLLGIILAFSLLGGEKGLSPEEKIEVAKTIPLNYCLAEDILSSGGLTYVSWSANDDIVKAVRDEFTFEFVVYSDGEAYFSGVKKNGSALSEIEIEIVLDRYYEIGITAGTLR